MQCHVEQSGEVVQGVADAADFPPPSDASRARRLPDPWTVARMKRAGGVALFGTEPKRMALARLVDRHDERMLQIDVLVHRRRPF